MTVAAMECDSATCTMSTVTALQRLAQARDAEAWSAIIAAHGARILQMARRISPDEALCEDICQETLLQIREHAGAFRAPRPPCDAEASAGGWIMRITCCTAFKFLRQRGRSSRREATAAGFVQMAAPAAVETAMSQEQLALLRQEVEQLPESLRLPLCLHYYGGMEYPEVAETLSCSSDAAKKRVQRGVERLRSRMAALGVLAGIGVISSGLAGGSAHAAEGSLSANTLVLDAQRQAAWQALLSSPAAPTLTGVAVIGGGVFMAKKIALGVAALLLLSSVAVEGVRIHSLRQELNQSNAAAQQARQRSAELEKQLAAARGDLTALQQQAELTKNDAAELRAKLAEAQKQQPNLSSFPIVRHFAHNVDPKQMEELAKNVGPQVQEMLKQLGQPGQNMAITLPKITFKASGAEKLGDPKTAAEKKDGAKPEAGVQANAGAVKAGPDGTFEIALPQGDGAAGDHFVVKLDGADPQVNGIITQVLKNADGVVEKKIDLGNGNITIQIGGGMVGGAVIGDPGKTEKPKTPPPPPEKAGEF
ncbi:MAG TPA: sigma-70 family RNA polymerase sigma factor [Planctomycetota bacterium]|jgi:RNA polymerase sigma-70 factor (ECF subfamily)